MTKEVHSVPENDGFSHLQSTCCPCEPEPVVSDSGTIVWKHQPNDERHLIAQAESVRMLASIKLQEEFQATKSKAPIKFHPYNVAQVEYPKASGRGGNLV